MKLTPSINLLMWGLIILGSCLQEEITISRFDQERSIRIKEGVMVSRCYSVTEDGEERLSGEFHYNDSGYMTMFVNHNHVSNTALIELYILNEHNVIIETKTGINESTLRTIRTKTFEQNGNIEIDTEYTENDQVYRSVYTNDHNGRNMYKQYFKDSVLIATYTFDWGNDHEPHLIQGFNPDGSEAGKLENEFKNGNLIEIRTFEDGMLTKRNSRSYNGKGQVTKDILEVPGQYRYENYLSYQDGLLHSEHSTYTFFNDESTKETRNFWKYERSKQP